MLRVQRLTFYSGTNNILLENQLQFSHISQYVSLSKKQGSSLIMI